MQAAVADIVTGAWQVWSHGLEKPEIEHSGLGSLGSVAAAGLGVRPEIVILKGRRRQLGHGWKAILRELWALLLTAVDEPAVDHEVAVAVAAVVGGSVLVGALDAAPQSAAESAAMHRFGAFADGSTVVLAVSVVAEVVESEPCATKAPLASLGFPWFAESYALDLKVNLQ